MGFLIKLGKILSLGLLPIRRNSAFFVTMYILGMICAYAVIPKKGELYSLAWEELFFDVYLLCVVLALIPQKVRRWIRAFFYVLAYATAVVDLYCFVRFDSPLTPTMLLLVGETNGDEATEFLQSYLSLDLLGSSVGLVLLLMLLHILYAAFSKKVWRWAKSKLAENENLQQTEREVKEKFLIMAPYASASLGLAAVILFFSYGDLCWENKVLYHRLMSYHNIGDVEHELTKKPHAVQSIKTLNMRGVNLSMPNKKEVIQYLDEISETAKLSQSVNTIVNDNGILKGYSTDGKGFFKSLEEEKIFMKDKNITILGTGGASIAIISQAIFEGIKNIFVFKRDKNWKEQKKILDNIASKTNCNIELNSLEDKNILKRKIEESDLLINATSVGMKENFSLIEDKSFFRKDLIVSDIIYNPSKTKLLQIAEKEGCKIINGIGMLLYQGALSFELWTNKKMPVDYIKEIIFNYFK